MSPRHSSTDVRPSVLREIGSVVLWVVTIMTTFATVIFFIAPLRTLPEDVTALREGMTELAQTQAVQAESLKKLAEIASDTKVLRSDVDHHAVKIENLEGRVDKIEHIKSK